MSGGGVLLFAGSVGVTCARGRVERFDGPTDMGASRVICWPSRLAAAPRGRIASAPGLRRSLYCGRGRVAVRSSQRPCRAGRWGPCPTGAACTRRARCVRRTATTAHRGSVRTRLDLLRPGASTSGRPSWIAPARRNRAWQVDFVPSATNPRNLPKQHAPTAQAND